MIKNKCILIFVILLVLGGCKKKPFDYRNKYIGDWKFNVHIIEQNMDSVGSNVNDTFVYVGNIEYGTSSDEILINYTSDDDVMLEIDKNGVVTTNLGFGHCTFISDENVEIKLNWGGLGAYVIHEISGLKM